MNEAIAFAQEAMDLYKKGEIDEVYMVYTEFVSPLTQNPKLLKVLPLAFEKKKIKKQKSKLQKKLEFNIYHQQKLY